MKPVIEIIPGYTENQSVVCIVRNKELPSFLRLGSSEKDYALKQLGSGDDTVVINSYSRYVYLVNSKEGVDHRKEREGVRRSAYNLKTQILSGNHQELVISAGSSYREAALDFAEGLLLSVYSFSKYKTREEEPAKKAPGKLLIAGNFDENEVAWIGKLTSAVWFSRNLINEPVNHLNAPALAKEISKAGSESGFSVEVLTKGKIEALKMGGLLSVNKGSVDPPVFCILEWKPAGAVNPDPVVLVGKGIVFDSGGLNLKTGDYMAGMHGDMAGAAIVTGVMKVLAETKVPLHVIGLVPSTDNRPGGNAYAQGDIITMHNGMNVEIGNTDAEGRLIMADAISYASRYKPELIIDIATLTGSAAMTFGNQAIALMTNADKKYFELLSECGNDVYERVAELPFWDEYGEMLKSDVADLRNIGRKEAGAITAGKFLERFAEYPLVHLDIAGTEMLKKDDYYRLKSSPATGLRLLATFLKRLAETYSKKN